MTLSRYSSGITQSQFPESVESCCIMVNFLQDTRNTYHGFAMREVSVNSTSLMKPISFHSKASVVCSVTAAIFIDFCLKKLNVFSQHIGKKTNEYLNSVEQMPKN